jgi:hypothetical protein
VKKNYLRVKIQLELKSRKLNKCKRGENIDNKGACGVNIGIPGYGIGGGGV